MGRLEQGIQAVILLATVFGVPFLYEVYPVLPQPIFYTVATGWVLFVVDSALTFVRPRVSYYLGLVLAIAALGATVSQPAHFALVDGGLTAAAVTILVGSGLEIALIVLVLAFIVAGRKKGQWDVSSSPSA